MSYVNENIRVLRNRMGLTQEKFAALMGINRKVVGSYEENRATPPLDKLNRMASLFGVSLDQLTQHRFSAESPLFEEEEAEAALPPPRASQTPAAAPAPAFEKKKPFSRTGENSFPYVAHKYFDKYLLDASFASRLGEMPTFSIPHAEADKCYRAFDVPADCGIQDGVLLCEEVRDLQALDREIRYLLVSKEKGILLSTVEPTLQGAWKIKTDEGQHVIISEIKEMWKPVGFFSRTLPAAAVDMKGIAAKVNALKNQIDGLL